MSDWGTNRLHMGISIPNSEAQAIPIFMFWSRRTSNESCSMVTGLPGLFCGRVRHSSPTLNRRPERYLHDDRS